MPLPFPSPIFPKKDSQAHLPFYIPLNSLSFWQTTGFGTALVMQDVD